VIRAQALAALLLWGALAHAQGPRIRIVDLGPGMGPRVVERALAGPHFVLPPDTREAVLPRDSTYQASVVVLGRNAVVEGHVRGDVIVIGGDLHIHPHASVTGQAISIGGGVYASAMANVAGGVRSYEEFTYEVAPVPGGFELRYVSLVDRPQSAVTLPGFFGIRAINYSRTDGVGVPFAPLIAVPGSRLRVEPRVTYRSQLGVIDPALGVDFSLDRRTTIGLVVGRSTYTNESWIWSDLLNSLSTLASGDDARNYYRATRAQLSVARTWEWSASTLTPYIGARWERAESVRPDSFATGGPWSFEGRHDTQDMLRPNPPIDSGTIISGLVGARFAQEVSGIVARTNVDVEIGTFNPRFGGSRPFGQLTFDGAITFPTFGTQSLRFDGHFVATASGKFANDHVVVVGPGQSIILTGAVTDTPRQRWAYVGGIGSIPTINMLSRGGDELIYLDGRYNIPIDRIQLPLIGPPVLTLRTVLAGADTARWPSLAQAVGVRASASVVYAEYLIDPSNRHGFFGVGLSLQR
jgi:hypothetical protein